MASYRQYCPVARASEILAERWNPLIVRNLMFGATTFTAIAGGVPHMSRSMLTKRLRELEANGVIAVTAKPQRPWPHLCADRRRPGPRGRSSTGWPAGASAGWTSARSTPTPVSRCGRGARSSSTERHCPPSAPSSRSPSPTRGRPTSGSGCWPKAATWSSATRIPGGEPAAYVVAGSKGVRGLAPRRTPLGGRAAVRRHRGHAVAGTWSGRSHAGTCVGRRYRPLDSLNACRVPWSS